MAIIQNKGLTPGSCRPQGSWQRWFTWICRSKREASNLLTTPRSAAGSK